MFQNILKESHYLGMAEIMHSNLQCSASETVEYIYKHTSVDAINKPMLLLTGQAALLHATRPQLLHINHHSFQIILFIPLL